MIRNILFQNTIVLFFNNFMFRSNNQVTRETVLKRSTREQKKPDTFLSPYIVRVIDITDKLNKVENDVYLWTFHNKKANRYTLLNYKSMHHGLATTYAH